MGTIQECEMMFAELIDNREMTVALSALSCCIEDALASDPGSFPERVSRLADSFQAVYWLLDQQR